MTNDDWAIIDDRAVLILCIIVAVLFAAGVIA